MIKTTRKEHENGKDTCRSINILKCDKCHYITNRKYNMTRHYSTKHIVQINNFFSHNKYEESNLQCPVCNILFTTRQAKYKHIKNVKCRQTDEIQLVNFGNEDLSGLLGDPMYVKKIEGCIRRFFSELPYLDEDAGKFIISEITKEIYFNKDYPQNQTIRKYNKKDDIIKIHNNNVWENRVTQDIVKKLVVKTEQYFTPYVDTFVDKMDKRDRYELNKTDIIRINNLRGFGNRMVWFNWDVSRIREVNDKIDRSMSIPRIYTSDVNDDTKTQKRILKNTSKQLAVDIYDATKNIEHQYRTPGAIHILTND